jgi:hypothetical protein
MKNANTYFVEHTDTFGGEANYCWVHRFKVQANSAKHAATKFKQEVFFSPLPKHKTSDYGDMLRIDIGNECAFIKEWEEYDEQYSNVKELD